MPHDLSHPHRLLPRVALSGFVALGLLTALAGCGDEESQSVSFAPSCPLTHIPPKRRITTSMKAKPLPSRIWSHVPAF
ncbi:hypothetical protein predicted by Glimmer/Critica [Acetobacter senegalensis]|uniref:Uncharacterized protein n=1 Tax=Acetobacter senegalensis TaxID=446692 RepID=A0A0U5B6G8_9PROT|nr:hypothetical protein [Acetobacter senegalensis]CEF40131.1 hypothetical protein predicted by Glimmer/Critica [Acetobacter senegalensis]